MTLLPKTAQNVASLGPETLTERSGSRNCAGCTKNQLRRPILKPFRDTSSENRSESGIPGPRNMSHLYRPTCFERFLSHTLRALVTRTPVKLADVTHPFAHEGFLSHTLRTICSITIFSIIFFQLEEAVRLEPW